MLPQTLEAIEAELDGEIISAEDESELDALITGLLANDQN